jgi:adenylate cyclase
MPFSLLSADGQARHDVRDGAPMLVGRAPTCDVPVFDPTVSRRHAELSLVAGGVKIQDLGSANGTFVNGEKITDRTARGGDVVTFGKVVFKLQDTAPPRPQMAGMPGAPAGATIVRSIKGGGSTSFGIPVAELEALKTPGTGEQAAEAVNAIQRVQNKLKTLLDVSQQLSKVTELKELFGKIVKQAQETLNVDRVAIMLTDDQGNLVTQIAQDKRGVEQERAVPQSIARQAAQNKQAILTDNAGEDTRFAQGASIMMQQVRSAICVPFVKSNDEVIGVLYLDNVSASHKFTTDDLDYCIAFASIVGTAIEREQFMQQIQRELVVRSNFQRYFAPALAERIASAGAGMKLGGDKRRVAVLFSDIRGFTALSETMNPDDMAHLLTEYFTEMVECVFANGGTLDKFIGDAVMAQWGAPLGSMEDPDKAMDAAINMIKELDQLNARWRDAGKPELQIGIGLNVGEAFAGNIGSERRMEYTVIGDTVNTASRLCSAAGPREILISDEFRRALTTPPGLVEMPPMELKGKSQPVPVYRVVL